MSDEKQKNTNYQTEFAFSFSNLADKVQSALGSIGDEPETAYFEEALGSETSAKVVVSGGVGKLHVHPGEAPALLAKVETRHVGKMHFSAESDGTGKSKTVKIENHVMKGGIRGLFGGFSNRDLFIDVALTDSLPLDLRVENGLGEALLDLRDLRLLEFKLEGGVGPTTVYMPAGDYKSQFDGGVGPAHIHLAASTGNKVRVEGGVGPVNVTIPEFADLTLDIEGGVGPVNIYVPAGTPLMVEFEGGIGPFSKPAELVQKNKKVWQTEGYDLAEKSVYLKLEGGVGPMRIRFVAPGETVETDDKAKRKTDE